MLDSFGRKKGAATSARYTEPPRPGSTPRSHRRVAEARRLQRAQSPDGKRTPAMFERRAHARSTGKRGEEGAPPPASRQGRREGPLMSRAITARRLPHIKITPQNIRPAEERKGAWRLRARRHAGADLRVLRSTPGALRPPVRRLLHARSGAAGCPTPSRDPGTVGSHRSLSGVDAPAPRLLDTPGARSCLVEPSRGARVLPASGRRPAAHPEREAATSRGIDHDFDRPRASRAARARVPPRSIPLAPRRREGGWAARSGHGHRGRRSSSGEPE